MVKLNQSLLTVSNGSVCPIMYQHVLKVKKDAPTFKEGTNVTCFIAKYDNGRFCVWEPAWTYVGAYHVFESEQDLNDTFDEQ